MGKLIKALRQAGVTQAVMCGGVEKTRMFVDVRPDLKALSLIGRIRHLADDGILRTFCQVLEEEGISILPSHQFVPELLATEGIHSKRGPTEGRIGRCRGGLVFGR